MNFFRLNNNGDLKLPFWLLGVKYDLSSVEDENKLLDDIKSHIWISYRHSFIKLLPQNKYSFTSDSGWGCMIRSGQMLLAETLLRSILGRSWRLNLKKTSDINQHYSIAHKDILLNFLDIPNINCDFSIHRIIHIGLQFGKKPGDWYGPETISNVLQNLINNNNKVNLSIYVVRESLIIKNDLLKFCKENNKNKIFNVSFTKLLVIIPLRLGLNNINDCYIKTLCSFLELRYSVGIIGGKPNHSLYFIGHQGDNLKYMDPHYVQESVNYNNLFPTIKDLLSYHKDFLYSINCSKIDPSLGIGFYLDNEIQLNDFYNKSNEIFSRYDSIFSIIDKKDNNTEKYNLMFDNDISDNDDWDIIS